MKYGALPYKIIHFDDVKKLIGKGWVIPKPKVRWEIFPKSEKDELPVLFRWTIRLMQNEKVLFSCIGEGKYILKFDKGETPDRDLDLLIDTSLINLSIKWENETKNTPLYGQTFSAIDQSVKNNIKSNIIQVAKDQGLL